ncbi:MAG: hypothetical protein MPW15_22115 [Candidatus Manganitrophus sp.]|nr:hypothetical protein [Candidatus Manganitrophus sp.]
MDLLKNIHISGTTVVVATHNQHLMTKMGKANDCSAKRENSFGWGIGMRQILYFIRTAVENLQINRIMAFFSFLSLSLTLTLFGVFLLFYYNVQNLLQSMQEDVQFSIYLSDGAAEEAVQAIKENIIDR